MGRICGQCGYQSHDTAAFCSKCGAKLETMPPQKTVSYCAFCGGQISAASKFCPQCGKAVLAASAQPNSQPPVSPGIGQPRYTAPAAAPVKKRIHPMTIVMPIVAVVLVAAILLTGLVAPGWMRPSSKPGSIVDLYEDGSFVQLTLPRQTNEQQAVYTAANMALQAYMNARLLTEKMSRDAAKGIDFETLAAEVRTVATAWDIADRLTTVAGYMGMRLSAVEADPVYRKALKNAVSGAGILKVSAEEEETDPHEWAEQIRQYYEAAKDGQKVRQMASILKTDCHTAMECIQEAEKILKGEHL